MFADPSLLRLVYQPIIDLQRGVVAGYETLARSSDPDGRSSEATPDLWFAAADTVGRGAELEAVVVRQALAVLPTVPPNCFLTVNVSPHLLTQPEVAEPLLAVDDLAPLVLELSDIEDDILAAVAGHARDDHAASATSPRAWSTRSAPRSTPSEPRCGPRRGPDPPLGSGPRCVWSCPQPRRSGGQ